VRSWRRLLETARAEHERLIEFAASRSAGSQQRRAG
jgi:hypothetical protein